MYKRQALAFPFLNKNGIEFKLDAVDFLRLPSPQCKQVLVERTASVGADVEAVSYTHLDVYKRQAVVCANDPNTEYAITRALEEGIAEFLMIGDSAILEKYPALKQYPCLLYTSFL